MKNIKVIIISIISSIIASSVMAYAATTYLASDISYGQTTVDYALNDLYEKSESGKVKELSFSDFFESYTEGYFDENLSYIYLKDNVIYMRIVIPILNSRWKNGVATIKTEYLPFSGKRIDNSLVNSWDGYAIGMFRINENGVIDIFNYGSSGSGRIGYIYISYLIGIAED